MLTLDEAAELLPILGLHKLIPSLIPPGADPNKIKIVYPDVVREIAAIVMETSKETLQVYFMWRALYNFAHDIYSRENNAIRRFYNFINGNVSTYPSFFWWTGNSASPRLHVGVALIVV